MNLQSIQDSLKGILPPEYYAKVEKIINENKDQVNVYIQNGDYVGLFSYIRSKMGPHSPSPSPGSPGSPGSPSPSNSWWWVLLIFLLVLMVIFMTLAMKNSK
jgi:hypothetical protein